MTKQGENSRKGGEVLKRIVIVLSITVWMLASCTKNTIEEDLPVEKNRQDHERVEEVEAIENTIKALTADPAKFHFVAGWLSDTEIIFVEKDTGIYTLNTFDILTGETDVLYEESTFIVDVLVHPSKKALLVHTAADSTAATVKIISAEGAILDEISIISSELAIDWNDIDPKLVLISAFYEDWTFDVFLYDGNEEAFGLTPMKTRFLDGLEQKKL